MTRFLLISSRFHAQQGQKVITSLTGVTILIRGQVAFQFVIFYVQLVQTCTNWYKIVQKLEYSKLQLGIFFVNQLVFQAPCISVIKYVDPKYRTYFHFLKVSISATVCPPLGYRWTFTYQNLYILNEHI